MEKMSFVSRETANASNIFNEMIKDKDCTIFLTLAGSTSAAGCMNIYRDMIKYNMIDAIVATGASIIDMDFFEALGFKHYQGSQFQDDTELRNNYIDRIYDTYIDEDELQMCDKTICEIADSLEPKSYTSREFIYEIGKYLKKNAKKKNSLIEIAHQCDTVQPPAVVSRETLCNDTTHRKPHQHHSRVAEEVEQGQQLVAVVRQFAAPAQRGRLAVAQHIVTKHGVVPGKHSGLCVPHIEIQTDAVGQHHHGSTAVRSISLREPGAIRGVGANFRILAHKRCSPTVTAVHLM